MCGSNEFFDLILVFFEVRVDVGRVNDLGALSLGQDEVEEEEESNVLVERYPVSPKQSVRGYTCMRTIPHIRGQSVPNEEPIGPALNKESASQYHPVHQPWC